MLRYGLSFEDIWTHIISLKREDAERLGYDHAPQWRNLLRAHRNDIAAGMQPFTTRGITPTST